MDIYIYSISEFDVWNGVKFISSDNNVRLESESMKHKLFVNLLL